MFEGLQLNKPRTNVFFDNHNFQKYYSLSMFTTSCKYQYTKQSEAACIGGLQLQQTLNKVSTLTIMIMFKRTTTNIFVKSYRLMMSDFTIPNGLKRSYIM